MTTTVTINACLSEGEEVLVNIYDIDGVLVESFTIQDGQSATRHVYNEREIVVKEILK